MIGTGGRVPSPRFGHTSSAIKHPPQAGNNTRSETQQKQKSLPAQRKAVQRSSNHAEHRPGRVKFSACQHSMFIQRMCYHGRLPQQKNNNGVCCVPSEGCLNGAMKRQARSLSIPRYTTRIARTACVGGSRRLQFSTPPPNVLQSTKTPPSKPVSKWETTQVHPKQHQLPARSGSASRLPAGNRPEFIRSG